MLNVVADGRAGEIGPLMVLEIPNLRKECAAALGELAQEESLAFLEPYRDSPDPDVRKNVRWVLEKITKATA